MKDEGVFRAVKRALDLTEGVQIARRYLAMNAFDGALTMLGLVLGGFATIDPTHPEVAFRAILLAAVGSSVAMAISGFSGSYLTERAEREREINDLGKAMLSDMSDTAYARAGRTTSVVVALVDGLSPAVTAIIIMLPLLLVPLGLLGYNAAFVLSIAVCMTLLFLLGLFLGHVSRKNIWVYGLKTLVAGIMTALIVVLISWLTGITA